MIEVPEPKTTLISFECKLNRKPSAKDFELIDEIFEKWGEMMIAAFEVCDD